MNEPKILKIKKINNVDCQLFTNHPTIKDDVCSFMTLYAKNYKFMPKFKTGLWDGKIRFVDKAGIFKIGLLSRVYNFIKNYENLDIDIDDELVSNETDFEDSFNEATSSFLVDHITPRDYQLEGALKAIKFKRGILEHATSAGKSLIIALVSMYLLLNKKCKKVMVLVPSTGLVEQMFNDFISYGINESYLGKFYEKEKNIDRQIVISTWQSMHPHKDLILDFDCIFFDEAHMQKANVVRTVGENASNATYRIGLTGTIDLYKADRYLIESVIGPVIHTVTPQHLITNNYASDVFVKIFFINHLEKNIDHLEGLPFQDEKEWIENYLPRNKIIKTIVQKHHEKDQNILILFDHLEHGELIKQELESLEKTGSKIFLVTGSTPAKEREKIRKFANENKKVVIIGTYGVFSTGVSINRLHGVIFAIAGKSLVRVMQSVGRGMRLHDEKNGVRVYDICDSFKYSEDHLKERLNIYDKAGYKVDIKEIDIKE